MRLSVSIVECLDFDLFFLSIQDQKCVIIQRECRHSRKVHLEHNPLLGVGMVLFDEELVEEFDRLDAWDLAQERIVVLMLGRIAWEGLDPVDVEVLGLYGGSDELSGSFNFYFILLACAHMHII